MITNVPLWEQAFYGNIPGLTAFSLNGNNGGITTTFEAVWPQTGAYAVRTAAMSTPYIASSDANDTSAGTGARTVRVTGVNTSFAAFSEDLTLNGQTSVNLVTTNVLFINSMEVLTAGSGGVNAGNIRVGTGSNTSGVPAVTDGIIAAGFNKSQSAMYAVPANKTLLVKNWELSSYGVTAAQTVQFAVDRYVTLGGILKRELLGHLNQAGSSSYFAPGIIKFAEKTILVVQALSAASTGPVQVRAEALLIDAQSSNNNQTYF